MRLIDADALLKRLDDSIWYNVADFNEAWYAVDHAPTVDAVPVVRCKDCLHNRACEIQYHAQAGDLFFCGAAERKDGDDGKAD